MFKIGEAVVCIDDEVHDDLQSPGSTGDLHGLKKGQIYHIRWIGKMFGHYDSTQLYVTLDEIYRGHKFIDTDGFVYEPPYFAWRFRRLEKKETDISIFKTLLNPTKDDIRANEEWLNEVKEDEKLVEKEKIDQE